MTTEEKVTQIYRYIQERCLWQFFSRTWDREENIEGIFKTAVDLLTGKPPAAETPQERVFYADAKVMVADLKVKCPWLEEAGAAQIREVMDLAKARLTEIAITKSLNQELNHTLY